MSFKENLAEMQSIDSVERIDIYNSKNKLIDSIENVPGKSGSVQVYANMSNFNDGAITSEMAGNAIVSFDEYTLEAIDDASSHPNIQRLFKVDDGMEFSMKIVYDVEGIKKDIEAIEAIAKGDRMNHPDVTRAVKGLVSLLESGDVRAAEKRNGEWTANAWVKQGILYGFGGCGVIEAPYGPTFMDKALFLPRDPSKIEGVRVVPGGTSIRGGAHIAPGVIVMPPVYANVGAFVDSGTMLDSHSLAGSCAQIGKNVHISAGAIVGGVLEPAGAMPCIVEDRSFMGINTSISEGTVLREGAALAPGLNLTSGISVYERNGSEVEKVDGKTVIPERALVILGAKDIGNGLGKSAAIIMKYHDGTNAKLALEEGLRNNFE